MKTKRHILVTGACGFIAFHLISKLLREGHSVIGYDYVPREGTIDEPQSQIIFGKHSGINHYS